MRRAFALSLSLLLVGLLCLAHPRAQLTMTGVGGGGFGGGGSCTFPTVSGLIGRYRADTGVTTVSGNVTVVLDQSGAGNTVVNSGTVPLNPTSAYNGKPAFDFAVGNDAALITGNNPVVASVTLSADVTALSMFFVGRMNTATTAFGRAVIIAGGPGADFNSANNITVFNRDNTNAGGGTAYNNVNYDITSFSTGANHRFGVVISGSTIAHYIDGATAGAVAFPGLLLPKTADVAESTNFIIGNQWSNGVPTGAAWDGPILETLIATSAFSPTNVANLETYYTCQYGP